MRRSRACAILKLDNQLSRLDDAGRSDIEVYFAIGLIAVYLIASALGLWWLCQSGQSFAEPTVRNAVLIVVRVSIVSAIFTAICHYIFGLDLRPLLVLSVVILGWTTLVSIDEPPGDSAPEILVWAILVLPFYFTREFALGFPVRKELVLEPVAEQGQSTSYDHLCGQVALVTSSLKPNGTIRINDSEFNARSDTGVYIDSGTRVTVSGHKGSTLVVTQENPAEP